MLKFLQRNYPTHRLKTNMGFKRSIILDNGQIYRISNKSEQIDVFYYLIDTLKFVFYYDGDLVRSVVKEFLYMK